VNLHQHGAGAERAPDGEPTASSQEHEAAGEGTGPAVGVARYAAGQLPPPRSAGQRAMDRLRDWARDRILGRSAKVEWTAHNRPRRVLRKVDPGEERERLGRLRRAGKKEARAMRRAQLARCMRLRERVRHRDRKALEVPVVRKRRRRERRGRARGEA